MASKNNSKNNSKDKAKEKILRAKEKIKTAIENLEQGRFQQLARALESNEVLSVELKSLYKENLSKRENIQWAYKQSKVSEQKKKRLIERLDSLSSELSSEMNKTNKEPKEQKAKKAKKERPFKGVKHHLKENLILRCGRNAKENLDLLRHARPWHLWMHLSDYPSGHLIVERPKGYELNPTELEKCAHFLFLKGAPKKLLNTPTQRYAVMFTECRYVNAQKKSKGLVTTQKHQIRVFTWESKFMHLF